MSTPINAFLFIIIYIAVYYHLNMLYNTHLSSDALVEAVDNFNAFVNPSEVLGTHTLTFAPGN
jgi:hypothetical protein